MRDDRWPLIPRFSVRSVLVATAVAAAVAFVLSQAAGGALWAAAAATGLAFVVLAFAIYAILFAVAWLISGIGRRLPRKKRRAGQGTEVADQVAAKTPIGLIFFALVHAHLAGNAWAVSGGTMTLPADGGNATGLRLTVDTRWIDAAGYRPVRIELKSTRWPAIADRVVTIGLRPHAHSSRDTIVVSQEIRIPAGSQSTRAVISVPQLGPWVSLEMDVYEEGRYIEPLSFGPSRAATTWSGTFEADSKNPAVLVIGDREKSPVDALPGEVMYTIDSASESRGGVPIALPTRWIDYSGLDLVVVSRRELAAFIESHPAQCQAIGDWVLAGGTIVVGGAGSNWQDIREIERMLSIRTTDSAVAKQSDTGAPQFKLRSCGLGMLVAVRSDAELRDREFPWQRLLDVLGAGRWRWSDRWGLSLFNPNRQVNDFLVPGVGRAPVNAFRVLMALFVVAIGPVNWLVLRKLRRLNLFVLTVPAIAAIATAGFVAYGLSADGLGLRLRTRSVEFLDQASGDSACLGRLSYYLGPAANRSLRFSGQTVVLPLDEMPADLSANDTTARRLNWSEEKSAGSRQLEQRLTDGWLKARTATQLVTARVAKTDARLDVRQTDAGGMQVGNQLGTRISHLIVADESGAMSAGEDLAAGRTAALLSVGADDDQVERFVAAVEASRPQIPAEMNAAVTETGLFGLVGAGQDVYGPGYVYRTAPSQKQGTSLLEQTIAQAVEQVKSHRMPPRTYLAIAESSPLAEIGSADAREEASFHLIVGRW